MQRGTLYVDIVSLAFIPVQIIGPASKTNRFSVKVYLMATSHQIMLAGQTKPIVILNRLVGFLTDSDTKVQVRAHTLISYWSKRVS